MTRISCPLVCNNKFLDGLEEGLRSLQLVDDGLHVGLVRGVAVQEAGPLVGGNPEPGLRGDLDNLGIVLPPQRLVRSELLLELHQ